MKPATVSRTVIPATVVVAVDLPGGATSLPCVGTASFVVDDLGDAGEANVGEGNCPTAGGICTLQAPLEEANANGATLDTITLSVAGTISLATVLPALGADDHTLDGFPAGVIVNGDQLVLDT
jgi:hypothetical protein